MFLAPSRPTMSACPDCTSPRTTTPTPSCRNTGSGCSSGCGSTSRSRWRWPSPAPPRSTTGSARSIRRRSPRSNRVSSSRSARRLPPLHRYGRSMAERVQKLAAAVRDDYDDGDTRAIWATDDAAELLRRLKALPGFGDQKARIFAALLGKQLDVRPDGWRKSVGPLRRGRLVPLGGRRRRRRLTAEGSRDET